MNNLATKPSFCDTTLDYLFPDPIEDQFEALRLEQLESKDKPLTLVDRISQWLSGTKDIEEHHSEYFPDQNFHLDKNEDLL
jgi:hypothetical protein